MSLNRSSLKALVLFHLDKVKLISATPNFYFLKANDIDVHYDFRKDLWTCVGPCTHSAFRGNNINQECYHIKSSKMFMKKREEENGTA